MEGEEKKPTPPSSSSVPGINFKEKPPIVGDLDEKESKKIFAMTGNPKAQQTKLIHAQKDAKEVVDSHDPQSTLYFKNCENCEYTIESLCTKVLVESCHNCKITFNKKIVTNMIDIWKCNNTSLSINTKVGTLQADLCKQINLEYHEKEHFQSVVWAVVHDMNITFKDDAQHNLVTGFSHMKQEIPNIQEDLDQFIIRFVKDKLLSEQIVRLANGYPTTEREAREFDAKQEKLLQKLAQEAGIKIGKKKDTTKQKPNDPCACGSGKKYKKCHGVTANA